MRIYKTVVDGLANGTLVEVPGKASTITRPADHEPGGPVYDTRHIMVAGKPGKIVATVWREYMPSRPHPEPRCGPICATTRLKLG